MNFEKLSQNFESIRQPSLLPMEPLDAGSLPLLTETEPALPSCHHQTLEVEKLAETSKENLPLTKRLQKNRSNRLDKFPELKQAFDKMMTEYSMSRKSSKASMEVRQSCKMKIEQEQLCLDRAIKNKFFSPRKIIKKSIKKNLS